MDQTAPLSDAPPDPVAPAAKPRRKLWKTLLLGIGGFIGLLALIVGGLWATGWLTPSHSAPREKARAIEPTGDPIVDAIRKSAEFLRIHQEDDGHFSRGILDPKPGFTSMVVDALARSPEKYRENTVFIKKAADAIVSKQQGDGSIATPGLAVHAYTTSISIMALAALENPAHAKVIERATEYLRRCQLEGEDQNLAAGGAGYSPGAAKASGDMTMQWIEGLKAAGVKDGDPAYDNAIKFLSRLQNNSELNKAAAPGTEIGDDGGFFYRPGESPAEFESGRGNRKIPRSYGLMTYAGLRSFLYLKVDKNDPRVQSAYKWVRDNYTLDENRNIGADGLYRYYLTMAKALAAYGEPIIETTDGEKHDWARELSERMISLQREDGSWTNKDSSRWMENDSILATSYAIRTLSICHEEIQKQKNAPKK